MGWAEKDKVRLRPLSFFVAFFCKIIHLILTLILFTTSLSFYIIKLYKNPRAYYAILHNIFGSMSYFTFEGASDLFVPGKL